jgi:hypothetical protein
MQGQISQTTDQQIGTLLGYPGLTVLLITSSWDGHGIIMRTLLEQISSRYAKVRFRVADVEDTPQLCKIFNVANPPGLLFIRDGELIHRAAGAIGGSTIVNLIERHS